MKLFVCYGNSERSVIAEELYNKYSNTAKSAGVNVSTSPRSENMFKLMGELNVDISGKPKTQVTEEMLKDFDSVYVLCEKEECPKYLQNSNKVTFWDVPNPYKKDYEFLVKTKNIIQNYLSEIIPK